MSSMMILFLQNVHHHPKYPRERLLHKSCAWKAILSQKLSRSLTASCTNYLPWQKTRTMLFTHTQRQRDTNSWKITRQKTRRACIWLGKKGVRRRRKRGLGGCKKPWLLRVGVGIGCDGGGGGGIQSFWLCFARLPKAGDGAKNYDKRGGEERKRMRGKQGWKKETKQKRYN